MPKTLSKPQRDVLEAIAVAYVANEMSEVEGMENFTDYFKTRMSDEMRSYITELNKIINQVRTEVAEALEGESNA